jgi:hypothetical protein
MLNNLLVICTPAKHAVIAKLEGCAPKKRTLSPKFGGNNGPVGFIFDRMCQPFY